GFTYAQIINSDADRRLPWSCYLARPGVIELIGKADCADLASSFLAASQSPMILDLGSISGRIMDKVQQASELDRKPPFKMPRTRIRGVVAVQDVIPEDGAAQFTIASPATRTLRLTVDDRDLPAAIELCEDLALHDWLLTALIELIARSRAGG